MNRRQFLTYVAATQGLCASPFLQLPNAFNLQQCQFGSHPKKVTISALEYQHIKRLSNHLGAVKQEIGYAHFNLLDFDTLLRLSAHHPRLQPLTKEDTNTLEQIFYADASNFGFLGNKVLTNLTDSVNKREVVKIPYTGHYLFKGKPYALYKTIEKEVGHSIILTSGVRSIVKQMDLFLRKLLHTQGNLRIASYSLAPAGYSYHAVGDFDVGKVGWGYKNFTKAFASTDEHKKLEDLGYIQIRYTKNNPFGVRYEPWHIKVV